MLARPAASIDTSKKSSSVRSPPSTSQLSPLLQMSPWWTTGVTASEYVATVGFADDAAVSCAEATVHAVLASPGPRYYDSEPGAPPAPWYQTTSSRPGPPAAIHGKMSALPGVGFVVVDVPAWVGLSRLTWRAGAQVRPPSVE